MAKESPGELCRLLDAGLTIEQVGRLYHLRQALRTGTRTRDGDHCPELRRLEFIRWLVETKRIAQNELDSM